MQDPLEPVGSQSVQLLRTYGRARKGSYSWASQGEFTIWAAYFNAIRQARRYIYIEDQYFYAFHSPPGFEAPAGKLRDSDLTYQLGEALKRGVDLVVMVPSRHGSRNPSNRFQLYSRRRTADYLRRVSASSSQAGRFVVCYLVAGKVDPVIHAKLMLVDDEFALIGSANVCQRSMTSDAEVQLGILDADNRFTRNLRLALWQEHLDLADPESILDPAAGVVVFHDHADDESGRLRLLPTDPGSPPRLYNRVMNTVMDPYRGPPRDG